MKGKPKRVVNVRTDVEASDEWLASLVWRLARAIASLKRPGLNRVLKSEKKNKGNCCLHTGDPFKSVILCRLAFFTLQTSQPCFESYIMSLL